MEMDQDERCAAVHHCYLGQPLLVFLLRKDRHTARQKDRHTYTQTDNAGEEREGEGGSFQD